MLEISYHRHFLRLIFLNTNFKSVEGSPNSNICGIVDFNFQCTKKFLNLRHMYHAYEKISNLV